MKRLIKYLYDSIDIISRGISPPPKETNLNDKDIDYIINEVEKRIENGLVKFN